MAYKAVLFDLDGTLLDTAADLTDNVNFFLDKYDWPLITPEDTKKRAGSGAANFIANCLPDGYQNPRFDKFLAEYKERYKKKLINKTVPYEGVTTLLEALSEKRVKMAVVSNKPDYAVKKLSNVFFEKYMVFSLGETSEIPRKPAPDMVLYALEQIGCTKDEALYVGDSEIDIQTVLNSGIKCVSVSWGFRSIGELLSAGAETIIDRPEELLKYV